MTEEDASTGAEAPAADEPLTEEEVFRIRVKAELRKRFRGLRKASTSASATNRSALIVEQLRVRPEIANAKSVALFWPIVERREVDLRAFDLELRARGVHVAYPAIHPETRMMTFHFVVDPAHLEERGMGFAEPPLEAAEARALDAIVVPALAIDPQGHRIGYGAGYYDRTLPRYAPPARTIGVAFDYQLVMEVPFGRHDVALDVVVTDLRTIDVAKEVAANA